MRVARARGERRAAVASTAFALPSIARKGLKSGRRGDVEDRTRAPREHRGEKRAAQSDHGCDVDCRFRHVRVRGRASRKVRGFRSGRCSPALRSRYRATAPRRRARRGGPPSARPRTRSSPRAARDRANPAPIAEDAPVMRARGAEVLWGHGRCFGVSGRGSGLRSGVSGRCARGPGLPSGARGRWACGR
jgi:hypothetical protein